MTEEESTEAEPANEQVSTYFDVFAGGGYFRTDYLEGYPSDPYSEIRFAGFFNSALRINFTNGFGLGTFFSFGGNAALADEGRGGDLYVGAFLNRHYSNRYTLGGYIAGLFLGHNEVELDESIPTGLLSDERWIETGFRGTFLNELLHGSFSFLIMTGDSPLGVSLSFGAQGNVGNMDRIRLIGDVDYVYLGDYGGRHDVGFSFRVAPLISRSFPAVGAFRFVGTIAMNFVLFDSGDATGLGDGMGLAEFKLMLNVGLSLGDSANLYQPPLGLERF